MMKASLLHSRGRGENHSVSILVLGAAPLSAEISFDHRLVIVAHGGAFHLPPLASRPFTVWALVAANGFSPSEILARGGMNQIAKNGPYDKLLLRDSLKTSSKSLRLAVDLSELARTLENLTYQNILALFLQWFSLREIFALVEWGPDAKPWHFRGIRRLTSLRRLLSTRGTKVSTGVLAVLVGLREAKSDETVVVAGIELERHAYSYSETDTEREVDRKHILRGHQGHLEADLKVLRRLCSRKGPDHLHFISKSIQAHVLADYS